MAYAVKADWTAIDPETLPAEVRMAYNAYKSAYRTMKAHREGFEAAMSAIAGLPADQRMVFGYNFGKLSVSVVPNDKPKPATKPTGSLADFLAAKRASGERT